MGDSNFNLAELKIALDPNDPSHILPPALPPTARVLDVGCGSGQSLLAAYPDRVSFGVDIDFDALKLGTRLSKQTCLVNSTAEALPFHSGAFDFVLARVSLPYTNIPRSLHEIRRVLKADGELWLVLHSFAFTWQQAQKTNYKGKLFFVYIILNSLMFHFFQRQFSFLGRTTESFQTERAIRRALARHGFQDIRVSRTRHFVVTARLSGSA
jgi:ubiquinone/menaquinone biosynthesis C-methylase UbiE